MLCCPKVPSILFLEYFWNCSSVTLGIELVHFPKLSNYPEYHLDLNCSWTDELMSSCLRFFHKSWVPLEFTYSIIIPVWILALKSQLRLAIYCTSPYSSPESYLLVLAPSFTKLAFCDLPVAATVLIYKQIW